jgi:hypothetical protein
LGHYFDYAAERKIIKTVIYLLGGLGKALFAEALVKAILGTVWDDPVIR